VDYSTLFTNDHVAVLHEWLEETGELYFYADIPRGGGGASYPFFVRSLRDIRGALAVLGELRQVELRIWRRLQFPIRGAADESLLRSAQASIADGTPFTVVALDYFPVRRRWLADGTSHAELRAALGTLRGTVVAIGRDPLDTACEEMQWLLAHPEEVMYFQVLNNGIGYDKFCRSPDRHVQSIAAWNSVK
jgi:hypothetical protein